MPQQPPAALPLGGLPAEWLDAIRNRHAAAEGGHWHLDPEPHKDRDTVRTTISGYHRRIGVLKFNAPYADENRRFVLNAHGDVALLLAELDRLTAELEQARQQLIGIATVRVWKNEDGIEFLYAADVRAAINGEAAESGCGCQTTVHPGHCTTPTDPQELDT